MNSLWHTENILQLCFYDGIHLGRFVPFNFGGGGSLMMYFMLMWSLIETFIMNFEDSFWGPESGCKKSNDQVQNNQTMKWKYNDYF
jgi:hypothetical protein